MSWPGNNKLMDYGRDSGSSLFATLVIAMCVQYGITINVPLCKKMLDIMVFFAGLLFLSYFKGSKKLRPPQKVPRKSSKIVVTKKPLCHKFS